MSKTIFVQIKEPGKYYNMYGKVIADETWSGDGKYLVEPLNFEPWNDDDDCPGDEEGEFFELKNLILVETSVYNSLNKKE